MFNDISSGGLESLFDNKKKISVSPPENVHTMAHLISWISNTLIKEKHDMFLLAGNIRPGILVLINDVDWELESTTKYNLLNNDRIAFISTLHGG